MRGKVAHGREKPNSSFTFIKSITKSEKVKAYRLEYYQKFKKILDVYIFFSQRVPEPQQTLLKKLAEVYQKILFES
jgi:hypothetical protein